MTVLHRLICAIIGHDWAKVVIIKHESAPDNKGCDLIYAVRVWCTYCHEVASNSEEKCHVPQRTPSSTR